MTTQDGEKTKKIEKPNLKRLNNDLGQKRMLVIGCVLVAAFMYPTVIRPFFNIGSSSEDEASDRKQVLDKTRPSFMPEWSSPFKGSKRDQ